jgi:hypothetical protein
MVTENEALDEVHLALDFLEFGIEERGAGVFGGEQGFAFGDPELGGGERLLECVAFRGEFGGELVLLGAAFGEGLDEGFLRGQRTFELGAAGFERAEGGLGVVELFGDGREVLRLGSGELTGGVEFRV